MEDLYGLVSNKVDPSKRQSFIDRYDTFLESRSTSEGLDLGVIGSFIHDGVIGKRLVEVARDTLQKQTVELDLSKKVETFEAQGNLV